MSCLQQKIGFRHKKGIRPLYILRVEQNSLQEIKYHFLMQLLLRQFNHETMIFQEKVIVLEDMGGGPSGI
jgi:hypothetical protein